MRPSLLRLRRGLTLRSPSQPVLVSRGAVCKDACGLWSAAASWRPSLRGDSCSSSSVPQRPLGSLASEQQPLRWTPASAKVASAVSSFTDHYLHEDNVLYLYSIQRVQLSPKVQEHAKLRDGLQQVDITWELGDKRHCGSGSARSKKAARREAAKKLLSGLPVSKDARSQMRKQMLHGLRLKLAAAVLEDGPIAAELGAGPGQQAYRVVWRVPQPNGRPPVELSASGQGATASEAQAAAWESLYLQAAGKQRSLQASAAEAARQQREDAVRQQVLDAAAGRQEQLESALSVLSSEAAGELAARHNAVVQRLRITARDEVVGHQAGYYCTLHWAWEDPNGQRRKASSSGLGASKRQAKGEAIRIMLAEQGMGGEGLDPVALNQAARIRSLAKAGDTAAVVATCSFLEAWPPSYWSLTLPEVWHFGLAQGDAAALQRLGTVLRQRLEGLGGISGGAVGLAPHLWESLLDACAHVACGVTAQRGLEALGSVPVDETSFPSAAHKDYFHHFRLLTAMERVGANQASAAEIRALGDGARGLRLQQQSCVLPYLTLAPSEDVAQAEAVLLAELRAGDVVYLRPLRSDRVGSHQGSAASGARDHLAVLTSVSRDPGSQKLTLRCSTLGAEDVDEPFFQVHGLDSEVTALRAVAALRAAAQPHAPPEERAAPELRGFSPDLTALLVGSFRSEGLEAAQASARVRPPGCNWADPCPAVRERLALVTSAASARGSPLTEAQAGAVRSALEQRLTLIHGPPGTGKTTAAACVVLAWRALGDKILCAADSNVAADNLHQSLARWGVKSYRFSPAEMGEDAAAAGRSRGAERLSAAPGPDGERRRGRARSPVPGPNSAYQRMVAVRDALGSFQVVVTTCSSAGHELLRSQTFPRVLVDECTQSVEPSTLLPLSSGCSHLVLIGDHKQLPPTVVSDEARKLGLDRSLFARLAEADARRRSPSAVAEPLLLDEQRRMHPSIAAFPNLHFYAGRVRDAAPSRAPVAGVPWAQAGAVRVLLVDVQDEVGEEQEGTSWRNAAEVDAVLGLAAHVLRCGSAGSSVLPGPQLAPEEVVVVTPYLQQKQLLQAEFSQRARLAPAAQATAQLGHIRVSTVDGFQGAESDLVIFSAVRSNVGGRLGFLSDVRRANVVLTRARRGLVVFADAATMRQAKGSVWAQWLNWVEGQGAVMSLEQFRAQLGHRPATSA